MSSFKIVVLGAGAVGKTAMIQRFITGTFPSCYNPSIEDTYNHNITFDGEEIALTIEDLYRCEDYEPILLHCIREGNGFLIVYEVGNEESFRQVESNLEMVRRVKECSCPVVICGNKIENEEGRVIGFREGQEFAQEHGCDFFEVSALRNTGIDEVFTTLVRKMKENSLPEKKVEDDHFPREMCLLF